MLKTYCTIWMLPSVLHPMIVALIVLAPVICLATAVPESAYADAHAGTRSASGSSLAAFFQRATVRAPPCSF